MLNSVIDSEEFKGKQVSLKLTFLLIVITAITVFAGAEVYFQFQDVRKDIKLLKEQIEYEKVRVDEKLDQIKK